MSKTDSENAEAHNDELAAPLPPPPTIATLEDMHAAADAMAARENACLDELIAATQAAADSCNVPEHARAFRALEAFGRLVHGKEPRS